MSNGDSGMPKPAKVEVGQRWVEHDKKSTPYVVVAVDPSKGAQIKFDYQENSDGYWHKSASILGDIFIDHPPGPETSGGGVAVGQRRRWNANEGATYGRDFTVRAVEARGARMFAAEHACGQMGCAVSAEYLEDHSEVLPSTPAPPGLGGEPKVTSGVAAQTSTPPVCRACGVELKPENRTMADGCPCNSPRGCNHGIVDPLTCTCPVCDQAQTGSSRFGMAALKRRPLREVATTRGNWIPYDILQDPDPFESYPLRRIDGVVQAAAMEAPSVRIVGVYSDQLFVEHGVERKRRQSMDERDAASRTASPSKPIPPPQSFCLGAGMRGAWNLRGGR